MEVSHCVTCVCTVVKLDRLALIEVFLCIVDDHVAAVEVVGAVVLRNRVEESLLGLYEVVCIDWSAVVPLEVLSDCDDICLVDGILCDSILANVLCRYILRLAHSDCRNDLVTGLVLVVVECVETVLDVITNLSLGVGLIGMSVPVGWEDRKCLIECICCRRCRSSCLCLCRGLCSGLLCSLGSALSECGECNRKNQQQNCQFLHLHFLHENYFHCYMTKMARRAVLINHLDGVYFNSAVAFFQPLPSKCDF